ncbi:MAG: Gfo/Idh/MocA family oxidoreductase [Candidatus Poribacteria bacterium]|nr:Gfo/Idh/MocA family oxidoreductase [Candidatus Poribacteria bacterium]
MQKYRVAIVGLDRMASPIDQEAIDSSAITLPYSIAAACQGIESLELAAGADVLTEKREAFGKRWGVTALYEDYLEIIAQEKPDLVAICTKGELHAEMAIRVAEAGVPMIYLEKAMACSMLEADAVLKACHANNVFLNTGVLRRFDSRYRQARQWIARGEIGDLRAGVHFENRALYVWHV